jgi:hypothetical protein
MIMARRPDPKTDFIVDVDGIGRFTFARRRMVDEINIQVEYARMIQGVEPTEWLATVCGWIASLRVLTVFAPSGWNIDEMDPLDDETYKQLALVHNSLDKKEGSFRRKPDQGGATEGE